MSTKSLSIVILLSVSFLKSSVLSQTEKKLTARDLFLSNETPAASKVEPAPGPKINVKGPKATTPVPLGLRYSILKQVRNNQAEEVDPDTIFHSGDRIRLSLESNDSGYLYVVSAVPADGGHCCSHLKKFWVARTPSRKVSVMRSRLGMSGSPLTRNLGSRSSSWFFRASPNPI